MAIKLYHLSTDPNLTVMTPRVPNNRLVRSGKEDPNTPRICFSPSIHSALAAAPPAKTGLIMYVYTPTQIDPSAVYKPTKQQVPDSALTHEIWYLKPCTVKKIAVILVGDIVRGKYWSGNEDRSGHYDLEWYQYKQFEKDPTKEEKRKYMMTQPLYRRKRKTERLRNLASMSKGAIAGAGGLAIFALIGHTLKRLINR